MIDPDSTPLKPIIVYPHEEEGTEFELDYILCYTDSPRSLAERVMTWADRHDSH